MVFFDVEESFVLKPFVPKEPGWCGGCKLKTKKSEAPEDKKCDVNAKQVEDWPNFNSGELYSSAQFYALNENIIAKQRVGEFSAKSTKVTYGEWFGSPTSIDAIRKEYFQLVAGFYQDRIALLKRLALKTGNSPPVLLSAIAALSGSGDASEVQQTREDADDAAELFLRASRPMLSVHRSCIDAPSEQYANIYDHFSSDLLSSRGNQSIMIPFFDDGNLASFEKDNLHLLENESLFDFWKVEHTVTRLREEVFQLVEMAKLLNASEGVSFLGDSPEKEIKAELPLSLNRQLSLCRELHQGCEAIRSVLYEFSTKRHVCRGRNLQCAGSADIDTVYSEYQEREKTFLKIEDYVCTLRLKGGLPSADDKKIVWNPSKDELAYVDELKNAAAGLVRGLEALFKSLEFLWSKSFAKELVLYFARREIRFVGRAELDTIAMMAKAVGLIGSVVMQHVWSFKTPEVFASWRIKLRFVKWHSENNNDPIAFTPPESSQSTSASAATIPPENVAVIPKPTVSCFPQEIILKIPLAAAAFDLVFGGANKGKVNQPFCIVPLSFNFISDTYNIEYCHNDRYAGMKRAMVANQYTFDELQKLHLRFANAVPRIGAQFHDWDAWLNDCFRYYKCRTLEDLLSDPTVLPAICELYRWLNVPQIFSCCSGLDYSQLALTLAQTHLMAFVSDEVAGTFGSQIFQRDCQFLRQRLLRLRENGVAYRRPPIAPGWFRLTKAEVDALPDLFKPIEKHVSRSGSLCSAQQPSEAVLGRPLRGRLGFSGPQQNWSAEVENRVNECLADDDNNTDNNDDDVD